MAITENIHLQTAYREYMNARLMVQRGTLGNANAQRERLRSVYRFIAGKPL